MKDKNNQFLEVIIFSLSLPRFLRSPRIEAYIEHIDSPDERRGGATRRSLNPGKEKDRVSSRGEAASARHVAEARSGVSGVSGAALRRKRRPPQRGRVPPHPQFERGWEVWQAHGAMRAGQDTPTDQQVPGVWGPPRTLEPQ